MSVEVFAQALIDECNRRLFDEGVPHIYTCLAQLSEEEIWRRPNEETVSIGNLVLHLCGNVRQWIVTGLGDEEDTRERDLEFSEKGPIPTDDLLSRLDATMVLAKTTIDNIDLETLAEVRRVQGQSETGIGILVHVVEHFSYHVGEITYAVKSLKAVDLEYYGG